MPSGTTSGQITLPLDSTPYQNLFLRQAICHAIGNNSISYFYVNRSLDTTDLSFHRTNLHFIKYVSEIGAVMPSDSLLLCQILIGISILIIGTIPFGIIYSCRRLSAPRGSFIKYSDRRNLLWSLYHHPSAIFILPLPFSIHAVNLCDLSDSLPWFNCQISGLR
jgi:hypothetical protein